MQRVSGWALKERSMGGAQEAPFWGFWQLRSGSRAAPLVIAATGIVLLGGDADQIVPLLHTYPGMLGKTYHVRSLQATSMHYTGAEQLSQRRKPFWSFHGTFIVQTLHETGYL